MKTEDVARQLELYSNAIVGFVVIQGLTFCYDFAKGGNFNKLVKTKPSLSVGLSVMFFVALIAGSVANQYLGKQLTSIDSQHVATIRTVYTAKTLVIVYFGLMPLLVTIWFGIRGM